jgi:probable rRNA maturation factor
MKILISNHQNCIRLDRTKIKKAAKKILSLLNLSAAELSIAFIDDSKMQQLNNSYRGINRSTDVLSFEGGIPVRYDEYRFNSGSQVSVLGDIVISAQKASSQAREAGVDYHEEICRLLIHGALHLLGYNHGQSRRDTMTMRKKEQEILHALQKTD